MAKNAPDILWELEQVAFSYKEQPVLRDIDLRLPAGKCYGILGPNGSGKTTLLDLLCGLAVADKGEVRYRETLLKTWPARELAKRVALVPQDFQVRFAFSVRDVVEMGRHPHLGRFAALSTEGHALVDAVMEEMGVAGFAARPVTRLSGGEKQRVAVARALVQDPEVLLLDEATSNLDIYHSLSILSLIRQRVVKQGLTVVAAIHDLNQAAYFCDELIFFKNGQIVCQGPTGEVLRPDVIQEVYGVEAQVREDGFSACNQVSYRLPG
ncbi:MAG: ABC transporter ATP-binding protein [Candidatus Electrothrix sp. AUS4]|nr:ABC transporter ATP-binding protein [Candidatus Electrothrix sp. AUS4]